MGSRGTPLPETGATEPEPTGKAPWRTETRSADLGIDRWMKGPETSIPWGLEIVGGRLYAEYPYSCTMYPRINPASGVPLSRQIVKEIKAGFLKGLISTGDQLPSVRDMASTLGINPTTVVKAYDVLENERLIHRRQGQGAFVTGHVRPMRANERRALLAELASELAIEGLRMGLQGEQVLDVLHQELKRLRPRKAR